MTIPGLHRAKTRPKAIRVTKRRQWIAPHLSLEAQLHERLAWTSPKRNPQTGEKKRENDEFHWLKKPEF